MSATKGPKVDLPEELAAELQGAGEESNALEIDIDVEEAGLSSPGPEEGLESAGDDEHEDADPSEELVALKERYLRLAADFDNFKRRSLKERQDLHNYANENLVKELLPTVDNLERAVGHGRKEEDGGEVAGVMEGVELTLRSLLSALGKLGVEVVDPLGEAFDPQVHEAGRRVPSEEHEPNTVIEVLQKGYRMKDRLLRPALVAVSSRDG